MGDKLVLFDCDGVLINTEEVGYRIFNEMLEQEGISYTREEFVELLSGITYSQFLENLRRTYLERKGKELPADFEKELSRRLTEAEDTEMKLIDGVKDLIANLKKHNIPFAVCSNSGAEKLIRKLKKVGLYDDFAPYIFSRNHVENPKPAPDMYLHAAQLMGVKPRDCFVVEDSVTGTMAGAAAGATVIGFIGETHRNSNEGDYLRRAGAKLVAVGMPQVWQHIEKAYVMRPDSPSPSRDFRP